ncbi:MAG: hypothetical protein JSS84_03360, partial [Bacteroidetes bacterium]|nr:hypothetical protein [Bacteroidota bacterium]
MATALWALAPLAHGAEVFKENMGAGTGTVTIAANTFQHSGTYTYTGTADTRVTSPSSGYAGASGNRNVFFSNSGSASFQMAGINTTGFTNLSLSFGALKALVASDLTELTVEYSTDGSTYYPLTFPAQATGSGTATWRLVTITGGTIPSAANLRLRWTNTSTSASNNPRIDDITLSGDPAVASTSVAFAAAASSVAENAGTTSLALVITNPSSSNATSVTLTASGATGRIGSFTTPVVFPAGDGSNQQTVVALVDNNLCDGNQTVTFTLSGISGGQGTPAIGATGSHVLTITDNETPAAPVATAATAILANGFTANWNAVNGATGYFLDVSTSPTFGTFTPVTVTEGFAGGRASLPTGWSQTGLGADYTSSGNYGAASPSLKFDASAAQLVSATYPGPANSVSFWYKGQGTNSSASALLTEGFDGTSWAPIGTLTNIANNAVGTQTYALDPNDGYVKFRFTYTKGAGNLSFDDFSVTYVSGSASFVPGYQNLPVAGISQAVTGLDPLTTYYYRVRSTGGCSSGDNSNVISATTAAGANPVLTAGPLNDLGNVCIGASGTAQSFAITGFNLTAADVAIGPLGGFTFATAQGGPYSATLTISQPGGAFSQTIWVEFSPVAEQAYDGNIPVGGGGAATVNNAVTGSGINTPATVATGGTTNVGTGQAEAAGSITASGCSSATTYGIEYSTTQGFTPGSGTQVPAGNLNGGSFSSTLNGLAACTNYYYAAYATNNGGTSYGTEQTFTTSAIPAPVAAAATGILQNGFTANWSSVAGASSYFLDVSTVPAFGIAAPAVLAEGFDNGETNLPAGWSQTGLGNYTSGGNYGIASPSLKFDGTGDKLTTALLSYPATSLSFWYKGQSTASSASTLLIEGYNGTAWSTLGTLTGIATNYAGTWSMALNPQDNYVQFRFSYTKAMGNLSFDDVHIGYMGMTPSFVPGYNNLSVAGTSQAVTGLSTATTYYYRVRAAGTTCTSANSNTIAATTLPCAGNSMVVAIHTDAHPEQITWELLDETNATIATGSPEAGQANTWVLNTLCISAMPTPACYGFRLYDSFGDGITNGGWQLRTTDGKVILGDEFAGGYTSPANPPATAAYGSVHSFCLPLGPANIETARCGVFNYALGNKIFANKVTGATQYEFEFTDPDAGFV